MTKGSCPRVCREALIQDLGRDLRRGWLARAGALLPHVARTPVSVTAAPIRMASQVGTDEAGSESGVGSDVCRVRGVPHGAAY